MGGALPRPLDRPRLSLQVQPVLTVFAAQVLLGPQRLRPRWFLGGFLRCVVKPGRSQACLLLSSPGWSSQGGRQVLSESFIMLARDSINWTLGAGG